MSFLYTIYYKMKLTALHFAKFTARNFDFYKDQARHDLLDCQHPIAPIEAKESTADILLKAIKALNENGVEIHIEYTERNIEKPFLKVHRIKEADWKYRRLTWETTFYATLSHPLHELELYFKNLVFEYCIK